MVRQEYIRELQLRANEILQEVRKSDNEHLDEFEGILKILWSYIMDTSTDKLNRGKQPEKVSNIGSAKGKRSWEDYIIDVLKEIGGRAKSKDIGEAIIKANPNIPRKRIMQTIRHKLSLLSKNGKIGANKREIKSEGYEFFIK
jgi:hypothetical protein